ncbi:MAG: efflux transporter outer membrane subunit, partial [Kangiellaceae bacterium]|nr:efflux transporter outer membrane subunit [Kangiellaceae bacterium]
DKSVISDAKNVGWMYSFKDDRLVALIFKATANNQELKAAALNVERAVALAKQAGAQLKPQVNLSYSAARSGIAANSTSNSSNQSLALQASWEIDLWGRISAGQQAAVASARAAEADFRFAQHSLAAATAKTYFMAIEAKIQSQILKDILESLKETNRIVEVQYKNGLATAQDVALAKSDLATTQEQLVQIESSEKEALRALEVLMGVYPEGKLEIRSNLPVLPGLPPPGVPSQVLERRPDLIASERRVAAAFNVEDQAKAATLPQLSLTASISGASNALSNITDTENVAWQLANNLLAPLFDGGMREAQLEVSTVERKQAIAAYVQSALNAFNEVETNLELATSLNKRNQLLTEAYNQAEKAHKIAELRYKEGEIALVDLLAIQQRVLSSRSGLESVRRLGLEQRVNLYLALGGDWK